MTVFHSSFQVFQKVEECSSTTNGSWHRLLIASSGNDWPSESATNEQRRDLSLLVSAGEFEGLVRSSHGAVTNASQSLCLSFMSETEYRSSTPGTASRRLRFSVPSLAGHRSTYKTCLKELKWHSRSPFGTSELPLVFWSCDRLWRKISDMNSCHVLSFSAPG